MKGLFLLVSMVTLAVHQVNPANILVVSFFSTKSHKLTYQPLIEELGRRGHNVTMVTPVKATKVTKGVTEIFTMDVDKSFNKLNIFKSKESGTAMGMDPIEMLRMVLDICRDSYDLPHVKALLEQKFDLAFIQPLFNDCALGLLYKLNVPIVIFTPVSIPQYIGAKIGAYFPSSTTPNFILGYPSNMTFIQRFKSLGVEIMAGVVMSYYYEPNAEAIYKEKLGEDIPSINEILSERAALALSNGHFSLGGIKPYNPDVIDVGGIHSRPAKPIPKDLEDFISKGKDGFILFSMGSAIKGDMMPEAKRQMILNVFSKLKQQVLWKWESESMPNLPKNVKLSKWLPQQDLLGHKDIKMFITHCGGGSTEEAIYHGVPLVGLPMMADQATNALLAKKNGLLIELDWNKLSQKDFERAINEILNNPKYRDNANKLSTLFKDRPVDPLDLGVYWIEYILRHKGAPHLRNASRQLNLFQYHSVDVMGAYLAIIGIVLYLIFAILRFVAKMVCACFQKKNSLDKGKKRN